MPQPQSAPLRLAPAGPVGRKLEKFPCSHMDEKVRQTYLQRSLLASHRTACRKLEKGPLPRKVFQSGLLTPLLASPQAGGRNLEEGALGPSGRKGVPNRPSEATSAEPRASWPEPGKRGRGASSGKHAPNMPSKATSAEPRASWQETGKRSLGAIWAKTCSKQAFRGYFCRAAGQLAET